MKYDYLFYLLYLYAIGNGVITTVDKDCTVMNYKATGTINIIFGIIGLSLINLLLRDKGIIPDIYVYIGLIGCFIVVVSGMYNICKYMFSAHA